MAVKILTPSSIWNGFTHSVTNNFQVVSERVEGNVKVSRIYLDTLTTEKGKVEVFGILAGEIGVKKQPAVLLIPNVCNRLEDRLALEFAKKGYLALAIDVFGYAKDREQFTIYPEDLEFANYQNVNVNECKENNVRNSFRYQWVSCAKNAYAFLKSQPSVNKVCAVGAGLGAGVLWQLSATEPSLSASVFILNSGWRAYKGVNKFSGAVEPQFSDSELSYIAGVEPQSYAPYVNCPSLMLSATNNTMYDCDRAFDTMVRINQNVYKAVYFSPNCEEVVDCQAYANMFLFLNEIMLKQKFNQERLLKVPETKIQIEDGKLKIEIDVLEQKIKSINLYISEREVEPSLREWKVEDLELDKKTGKYFTYYAPHVKSGLVAYYVKITNKNGYSVTSNVQVKTFKEEEVTRSYKSNVIFSSRKCDSKYLLINATGAENNEMHLSYDNSFAVEIKEGPMEICGAYCKYGLKSFRMNSIRAFLSDRAMLMLDVYCKEDCNVTVKLTNTIGAEQTNYFAVVPLKGGNIWQNIKIDTNKFKTKESRVLKSYKNITSIEIFVDKEYLVNNILWV